MSPLKEYTPLPQHVVDLNSSSRDPEAGMYEKQQLDLPSDTQQQPIPSICGMPLKYLS